jgi:sucrose synthase
MISKIAIISPHGWFGQENVLGKPDTGGQVVYILDQVRALEKNLKQRLESFGFDITPKIIVLTRMIPNCQGTTSNQSTEKIHRTTNSWILRVPFYHDDNSIVNEWVSRFKIWPYLNRFAMEAKNELTSIFEGRPDLIIGNYSDGNLVATLLSQEFDVVQCNISHALEKAKYLFSDLYWTKFEDAYHFSQQFTADLISMNMADFIITSTYQEIAGTSTSIGQYESYLFFTMPGLFQVENGIDLFHPKFNVIPPGVDEDIFFPHTITERRLDNQTESLTRLLFEDQSEDIYGRFADPEKTTLMTMARLDRVKNLTGLVESFGMSDELKEKCNLMVIAGVIKTDKAADDEERAEINRMYELIGKYDLEDKIRWLGIHLPKDDTGEAYRIVADHKGIFVQPALFEGFGLTVLEAMLSGLPVFATEFGGPSEIIQDGKNGFLINPSKPELISTPILSFVEEIAKNKSRWQQISENAVKRVEERFTWELHSNKLLDLTALYGFWRYSVSKNARLELQNYCHLLFQLLFERRNERI